MKKSNIDITCQECGEKHEKEIVDSIDASLYAELREKARDLSFFMDKCPYCGHETILAYNCLYNDIDKRLMIWLMPEPTKEMIKEINEAGKPEIAGRPFGSLYIERIVTTPNQLKEKLLIFDKGYDDRIVELLKVMVLSQLDTVTGIGEIKSEPITEMLYDNMGGDSGSFVIFFENREPIQIPFNYDVYIKLFDDFIEMVGRNTKAGYQFVDYQWALEIIKKQSILKKNNH